MLSIFVCVFFLINLNCTNDKISLFLITLNAKFIFMNNYRIQHIHIYTLFAKFVKIFSLLQILLVNPPLHENIKPTHTNNIMMLQYQSPKLKLKNEVLRKFHPHTQKTMEENY